MERRWWIVAILGMVVIVLLLSVFYPRHERFYGRIDIPQFSPFFVQDTPIVWLTVNESQVGLTLAVKWSAGLLPWSGGEIRGQPMSVSLHKGGVLLLNETESIAPIRASVVTECESNKVKRIVIQSNRRWIDIYPKNATLEGDYVNLGGEKLQQLTFLRVVQRVGMQDCFPYPDQRFHVAYTLNETGEGWMYTFTQPGKYFISYKLSREVLRQADRMFNPTVVGIIYASLEQHGKLLWDNVTSIVQSYERVVRGSGGPGYIMQFAKQYVAIPEGTENITLKVMWKSSTDVRLSIVKDRLEKHYGSVFNARSSSGEAGLEVTPGTYWLVFTVRSDEFLDGGFVEFDVWYPAGKGVKTWFDAQYPYYG